MSNYLTMLSTRQLARIPSTILRLKTNSGAKKFFSGTSILRDSYALVGLGAMGAPMAANLRAKLQSTDSLLVHDVNRATIDTFMKDSKARKAEKPGQCTVQEALSPREAAENADTLITVLPEPSHVRSVFDAILQNPLPARTSNPKSVSRGQTRLFIDCSTIDPLTSRGVASSILSSGAGQFVDAPMSGGVVGARAGTLTFMLGANSSEAELRARKLLSLLGKRIFTLGGQGAGIAGKLANNYLLAISNIATCEAMNLGVKLGLDGLALAELINSSSGRCWSSEVNNPVPGVSPASPAERDFDGGFGVSLMRKDLRLAMAAAQEVKARLELAEHAKQVYEKVDEAESGKDFSVTYRWLQKSRSESS